MSIREEKDDTKEDPPIENNINQDDEKQNNIEPKKQPAPVASSSSKKKVRKETDDKKDLPLNLNAIQQLGNMDIAADLVRKIQLIQASTSSAAKDPIEAKHHKYQFWDTQPVPALGNIALQSHIIFSHLRYASFGE
jgi:hypothetical protein